MISNFASTIGLHDLFVTDTGAKEYHGKQENNTEMSILQ
jgi:hypothetical protein